MFLYNLYQMICDHSVCGLFGLWPFRFVAVSVCGYSGLWPFRFVAVPVYGRFGMWPLRFMAVSVCGLFGLWPLRFVAVSVCGRSGLWPFRFVAVPVYGRFGLWPFRSVAVSVCGRFGFGCFGLWLVWPETVDSHGTCIWIWLFMSWGRIRLFAGCGRCLLYFLPGINKWAVTLCLDLESIFLCKKLRIIPAWGCVWTFTIQAFKVVRVWAGILAVAGDSTCLAYFLSDRTDPGFVAKLLALEASAWRWNIEMHIILLEAQSYFLW